MIVYRVQTTNPLGHPEGKAPVMLLTPTALKPGESFSENGTRVSVTKALAGGFSVRVRSQSRVPDVVDSSAAVARQAVQGAGLVARFRGPSGMKFVVVEQSPEAGELVNGGSTVTLATGIGQPS